MRKRDFIAAATALGAAALTPPAFAATGKRPNILMIPVDDLKPLLRCYGEEGIPTPNIDRLAARGTVFLGSCCQQAVCGPTRACLMTGLYPDSTGVWDLRTRMRDVNPDVLSLPQYFRQQGYETTGVGKTYDPRCVGKGLDAVSWSIPYGSEKRVFNRTVPRPVRGYHDPATKEAIKLGRKAIKGKKFRSGGAKIRAMAKVGGPRTAPATECWDVPDDAYPDGALAKAGCRLLEKLSGGDKPFFLSVGFYKPHLPFVAPKKYWDMYDRESLTLHPFQKHSRDGPEIAYHNSGELRSYSDMPKKGEITPEMQKRLIHGYRACVSYVDAQIGKLLDKLDELGLADNTIVCLWGDHGWHLGDHGMWCKHSNFEQACRAPLLIAAPGMPTGNKTDAPVGFVDVFPTLCALAGLPIPSQLQGKSIAPLMTNPAGSVREAILSQYPRRVDGQPVMGYTLRDKRYRYVKWVQMDFRKGERSGLLVARELYDYQTNPHETVNLATAPAHAPLVDRFEAIFKRMNVAQHTGTYESRLREYLRQGVGCPIFNGSGTHLEARTIPVKGQPFSEACEVTVTNVPEKRSGAAYKRLVMIPVKKGRRYRVTFNCRSERGAEFFAIFQHHGAPYVAIARQRVKAGPEWQKVELTGTAKEDYEARKTVLTCHLGEKLQTVQFAGVKAEGAP